MAIKILKKIYDKNPIHPTFFIIFIWFLISEKILSFFVLFITLLIHELGHYLTAKKLSYKLNSFKLNLYGAEINFNSGIIDNNDELLIALAGPLTNIFLAIFITAFWWISPAIYNYTYLFVFENFMLGLFNLLPAYPLDGGRVVCSILSRQFSKAKVLKFLKLTNVVFVIIFFAMFIISCFTNYNSSLILMCVFLLCGTLESSKAARYEHLYFFKKKKKKFSKARVLVVSNQVTLNDLLKKIERAKETLFYVQFEGGYRLLSEETIIRLSSTLPLEISISNLFKK